jgi:hypothetical protein
VCQAGRDFVEETAWSLTEAERERLWFDVSCLWGPPDDHLAGLLRTLGPARFIYGSGWPLRLTQAPRANLALLPEDVAWPPLALSNQITTLARSPRGTDAPPRRDGGATGVHVADA